MLGRQNNGGNYESSGLIIVIDKLRPVPDLSRYGRNGQGIESAWHPTIVTSHRNTNTSNETILAVVNRVACN